MNKPAKWKRLIALDAQIITLPSTIITRELQVHPGSIPCSLSGRILPGISVQFLICQSPLLPQGGIFHYNSGANVVNKGNPAIHLLDTDKQ